MSEKAWKDNNTLNKLNEYYDDDDGVYKVGGKPRFTFDIRSEEDLFRAFDYIDDVKGMIDSKKELIDALRDDLEMRKSDAIKCLKLYDVYKANNEPYADRTPFDDTDLPRHDDPEEYLDRTPWDER